MFCLLDVDILAECLQDYCTKIKQMLACLQMLSAILLSCLVTKLQKSFLPGLEPRTDFCGCCLCSYNLPTKTNNFGLGIILLSYLVAELENLSSPGLKVRIDFLGLWPLFPIISLLKQITDHFVVLQLRLFSVLQKLSSLGFKLSSYSD